MVELCCGRYLCIAKAGWPCLGYLGIYWPQDVKMVESCTFWMRKSCVTCSNDSYRFVMSPAIMPCWIGPGSAVVVWRCVTALWTWRCFAQVGGAGISSCCSCRSWQLRATLSVLVVLCPVMYRVVSFSCLAYSFVSHWVKSWDAELFKTLFKVEARSWALLILLEYFQSPGSRFDFEHFFAKRAEVGWTWVIGDQTWT